jgi:hypothetical protein
MQIHIQRKHHPYPQIYNVNPSALVNEPQSLINFENSASYWNTSMQHPSSSAFLTSPPPSTFYPNTFFNHNKVKDEDEKERRESRRRFNKTSLEYMQKIVIPSLNLQNTQFNDNKKLGNIIFIDPMHMPKAHKIYKCDKCFTQTLKPFFDFKEIHPSNKFRYFCFCSIQQQKFEDNNDSQIQTLKLQEILLSAIDYRLKSENILIKMIVFPNNFIENPLSLKILTSLFDIMGNEEGEDYPFRWLFELLLNNEGFIDLGGISSQHWARRAYDNDNDNDIDIDGNSHSAKEDNSTKFEKEELKQFISITGGTFALIKFKIHIKTIYTFSYLLLYNKDK